MSDDLIIFVYGTLKKNCIANYLLHESTFLGTGITKPEYQLYSCGSYPALVESEGDAGIQVEGELYRITDQQKNNLHTYEGVQHGLYSFKKINLHTIKLNSFINIPDILNVYAYLFLGDLNSWQEITKWTCPHSN
jgi:gamma-glutamylcyclotransferase (GGCT)/AIG2-like uncharacterized protein YtfP